MKNELKQQLLNIDFKKINFYVDNLLTTKQFKKIDFKDAESYKRLDKNIESLLKYEETLRTNLDKNNLYVRNNTYKDITKDKKIDDITKNSYMNTPIKNLRLYIQSKEYKDKVNEIQSKFNIEALQLSKELKALKQVQQELKDNPLSFIKEKRINTKENEIVLINFLEKTNVVDTNVKQMKTTMLNLIKDIDKKSDVIDDIKPKLNEFDKKIDDINKTINNYSFDR